jgi:hypothetical protein
VIKRTLCAAALQQKPKSFERQHTFSPRMKKTRAAARSPGETSWKRLALRTGMGALFLVVCSAAGVYYGRHQGRIDAARDTSGWFTDECSRLYNSARTAIDSATVDRTAVGSWRIPSSCGVRRRLSETGGAAPPRSSRQPFDTLLPPGSLVPLAPERGMRRPPQP